MQNIVYNYFRYYDPELGRYITSDPIGLAGGLNTYLYAEANPLTLFDLLGLKVDKYGNDSTYNNWSYNGQNSTYPASTNTLGACQLNCLLQFFNPVPNHFYELAAQLRFGILIGALVGRAVKIKSVVEAADCLQKCKMKYSNCK